MSLVEVNKMYENINSFDSFKFMLVALVISIIVTVVLGFAVVLMGGGETSTIIIILICLLVSVLTYTIKEKNADESFKNWKETVKTEHIDKLPKERYEVIDYKTISGRQEGNKFNIEFTYLYNDIKTTEVMEATVKTVENLEKPYITFNFLEQDLPLENKVPIYRNGYYNIILYIPK
jgi:hypothetical protein